MTDHSHPTSEWEHSHAVNSGDVLVDEDGEAFTVTAVNDDGSVDVELRSDEYDVTDTWTEEAVRVALVDGGLHRESDGRSHELATF